MIRKRPCSCATRSASGLAIFRCPLDWPLRSGITATRTWSGTSGTINPPRLSRRSLLPRNGYPTTSTSTRTEPRLGRQSGSLASSQAKERDRHWGESLGQPQGCYRRTQGSSLSARQRRKSANPVTDQSRQASRNRRDAPLDRRLSHAVGVTPEQFVDVLRLVVVDQAAQGTVNVLRSPPGRRLWPVDVRRSGWFNSLHESDQQIDAEVARSAAFMSAFSFCNILDGTTAFDSDHGSLRLTYIGPDGSERVLNDPETCELHAKLRGDGPPL